MHLSQPIWIHQRHLAHPVGPPRWPWALWGFLRPMEFLKPYCMSLHLEMLMLSLRRCHGGRCLDRFPCWLFLLGVGLSCQVFGWLIETEMVGFPPKNHPIKNGFPLFSPSILGAHPYFWKHPNKQLNLGLLFWPHCEFLPIYLFQRVLWPFRIQVIYDVVVWRKKKATFNEMMSKQYVNLTMNCHKVSWPNITSKDPNLRRFSSWG